MFLLDRIDFLALVGLLAQTALTWIVVGMFATLMRAGPRPSYFRTMTLAFLALAVGLSVISVRFFQSFDVGMDRLHTWEDGQPKVVACYVAYQLAKGLFALLLLRGAFQMADRPLPRAWSVAEPLALLWLAATPLFEADIEVLLILQAPVMVACNGAAWWVVRSLRDRPGAGVAFMRFALLGMAAAWTAHAAAVTATKLGVDTVILRYLLSFNSFVDLFFELFLAAGLIITPLEEAEHRLRSSRREQERLQAEHHRNEKLRALGTLLSGVAHELNNPLTAILGFSEILLETPVSANEAREAATVVREQAERCRGIVRSLSGLAGGCAHSREPVDASELVQRVARGLLPALKKADLHLDLSLDDVPPVLADRVGLEQVLTNLLMNAIQASPRGTAVRVEVKQCGEQVQCAVEDQGPGIPAELRARVFEPFFTTKAPGQGTGLGLAVAHAILRNQESDLGLAAASSGGARFEFCLLLAGGPPARVASAPPASVPRSLHLLVVEDERMVRSIVRRRALKLGWTVTDASSAEDALQRLEDESADFDTILCDLRMPGIGGIGFHDHLQRYAPHWLQRCTFFTGNLAAAETVAFSKRCAQPLLEKPLDMQKLIECLLFTASAAGSKGRAIAGHGRG